MKPVIVLLVSMAGSLTRAQYYYQGLMDYLENRMLAIELIKFAGGLWENQLMHAGSASVLSFSCKTPLGRRHAYNEYKTNLGFDGNGTRHPNSQIRGQVHGEQREKMKVGHEEAAAKPSDRMELWHEQSHRYHTELLEFKKIATETIEGLGQEHGTLLKDLDGAAVRVDRVEREMDYLETQTSPRACVNKADKVVEQGAWILQERRGYEEEEEEGDWEEVHSRVSDCVDIISSIRSVKILKRVGSPKGMWIRDPRSSKVYIFNGTAGDDVYQFNSVLDFSSSPGVNHGRPIRLPSLWSGPGSAVYNDYLYYIQQEADAEVQVVKYDLLSGSVTDTAMFPVDSRAPVYTLNPETVADLAADDEGLWLLYAASESEPNINLAKMDPATLDIEQMWDTRCPRENAEAAFVVCGTVYVVYNTRLASRSRVQCVFDVNDMVVSEEAPLFYFPRRYGAHASLKYNPEEKQLYAWDDGYQILYRLTMKRKLLV